MVPQQLPPQPSLNHVPLQTFGALEQFGLQQFFVPYAVLVVPQLLVCVNACPEHTVFGLGDQEVGEHEFLVAVHVALFPPPVPRQVQVTEFPEEGNDGVEPDNVPAEQNAVEEVEGQDVTLEEYVCRLEPQEPFTRGPGGGSYTTLTVVLEFNVKLHPTTTLPITCPVAYPEPGATGELKGNEEQPSIRAYSLKTPLSYRLRGTVIATNVPFGTVVE